MKKFAVRDYETGTVIEVFNTREEAVQCLKQFEEQDIEDGIFEPGFYEVAEIEEDNKWKHWEYGKEIFKNAL